MNIPDYAINDKRLTDFQRILFGFLYEKCKKDGFKDGFCDYTNTKLGEIFEKVPEVISKNLSVLQSYNYIVLVREPAFTYIRKIYLSVDKN